jgi:hypothetical protein
MKIQIAMNQKKKTIIDWNRSVNVIPVCTPSNVAATAGAGLRDRLTRDWRARVAAHRV